MWQCISNSVALVQPARGVGGKARTFFNFGISLLVVVTGPDDSILLWGGSRQAFEVATHLATTNALGAVVGKGSCAWTVEPALFSEPKSGEKAFGSSAASSISHWTRRDQLESVEDLVLSVRNKDRTG